FASPSSRCSCRCGRAERHRAPVIVPKRRPGAPPPARVCGDEHGRIVQRRNSSCSRASTSTSGPRPTGRSTTETGVDFAAPGSSSRRARGADPRRSGSPLRSPPGRRPPMRFMMIVKANKDSEAGDLPDETLIAAMTKYNEELAKAGVLLDLSGLQPSSKGARVKFSGGKRTVVDGPFTESKELIAGYWLIQVKSREEAIEWAKRAPAPHGEG